MGKASQEDIYLARRAAVLGILTGSGVPAEGAEEIVAAGEANANALGIPRLERTFWESAAAWTTTLAHPNREGR